MELEITWERAVRVWWSYLWRNLIAVLASMVICGILGGILGFIGAIIHVPSGALYVLIMIISFVIGLGISIVPMKMILGKDFGEFRLLLVGKQ